MDKHTATEESYKNGYDAGHAAAMARFGDLYAIVAGCYSDWSIIGYCTSKEEAYNYCAVNKSGYYPMRMKHLTPGTKEIPRHVYEYVFTFRQRNGAWTPDYEDECLAEIRYDVPSKFTPVVTTCNMNCAWPFIKVSVYRQYLDVASAKKIALDCLYKHLAEQEGL